MTDAVGEARLAATQRLRRIRAALVAGRAPTLSDLADELGRALIKTDHRRRTSRSEEPRLSGRLLVSLPGSTRCGCGTVDVDRAARSEAAGRGWSRRASCWRIGKSPRFLRWRGPSDCIIRLQRCVERAVVEGPLAALDDRPRPGREPTITLEARTWLVDLACRKAKELGYPHELWTTRLLAQHTRAGHACLAHLAQGTVCKILDQEEIKPHKVRYYLEQRDPIAERMAKVLNLVEGFFSKLARSVLRHIRVASKQELKDRLMAAMDYFNQHPIVHTWTYKLDKAA
jgi:hypothetical protein